MLNIRDVFTVLAGLFFLIAVGTFAVKRKIVPATASKPISSLLLNIALPCTIIMSMQRPYEASFLPSALTVVGLSFLIFIFNCLAAWFLAPVFGVAKGSRGAWVLTAAFCNTGFMGFPVTLALFGEDGLALASMINIPFNLLIYSVGVWMMRTDSPQKKEGGFTTSVRSILLTPINVSLLISLILYLLQITIPTELSTAMQHLANTTTPLSMFVTGMALANAKLSEVFTDKNAYTASLMRLAVLPLLCWLLLSRLPLTNPLIAPVLTIIMAMPAPGIATTLAEIHGGDTALCAKTTFLTSLFCVVTIPLLSLLL